MRVQIKRIIADAARQLSQTGVEESLKAQVTSISHLAGLKPDAREHSG